MWQLLHHAGSGPAGSRPARRSPNGILAVLVVKRSNVTSGDGGGRCCDRQLRASLARRRSSCLRERLRSSCGWLDEAIVLGDSKRVRKIEFVACVRSSSLQVPTCRSCDRSPLKAASHECFPRIPPGRFKAFGLPPARSGSTWFSNEVFEFRRETKTAQSIRLLPESYVERNQANSLMRLNTNIHYPRCHGHTGRSRRISRSR